MVRESETDEKNLRKVWETIGQNDLYRGTGGPTRAVPSRGIFAQPDKSLFALTMPHDLILDVGCGYGRNSIPLVANLNRNVVACDVSLGMAATVIEAGVPFVLCDLRYLPFRDQSVDSAICSVVLIHLRRREVGVAISELKRVARRALIIMPNPLGPASVFGLKPSLFTLMSWVKYGRGTTRRRFFEDIPAPRGYIVNFYLPWAFLNRLTRSFNMVSIAPATPGKMPSYLTDRLVFVCGS